MVVYTVFNGENAKHNYSLISCHILYTANKGNKKTNNRLNNKSFFFIVYFVFIIFILLAGGDASVPEQSAFRKFWCKISPFLAGVQQIVIVWHDF